MSHSIHKRFLFLFHRSCQNFLKRPKLKRLQNYKNGGFRLIKVCSKTYKIGQPCLLCFSRVLARMAVTLTSRGSIAKSTIAPSNRGPIRWGSSCNSNRTEQTRHYNSHSTPINSQVKKKLHFSSPIQNHWKVNGIF